MHSTRSGFSPASETKILSAIGKPSSMNPQTRFGNRFAASRTRPREESPRSAESGAKHESSPTTKLRIQSSDFSLKIHRPISHQACGQGNQNFHLFYCQANNTITSATSQTAQSWSTLITEICIKRQSSFKKRASYYLNRISGTFSFP